ncbi:hypothetical protein OPT61_g2613 [Boeremia exigua]|uniref:Uncharacterized protein n=1 Tax=Boeremia exigua TaxID=749465 RepID=A0ACC2IKW2_9PLEO|nr:hypothetical protein OPT61_g2613 [Boeremia exigua]
MISQHTPLLFSPHFCEDLSACPPVDIPPPTQTHSSIELSPNAQKLYDFILKRYKHDAPSTPGLEVKIEFKEWDLIQEKASEQSPDIYDFFLWKAGWEWDAPRKGERLGVLRIMGRESALHASFGATLQGDLLMVAERAFAGFGSPAKDAAGKLKTLNERGIHLQDGSIPSKPSSPSQSAVQRLRRWAEQATPSSAKSQPLRPMKPPLKK